MEEAASLLPPEGPGFELRLPGGKHFYHLSELFLSGVLDSLCVSAEMP